MKLSQNQFVIAMLFLSSAAFAQDAHIKPIDPAAQENTKIKVPVSIGESVIDNVENVRESIEDLVQSLESAGQADNKAKWKTIEQDLTIYRSRLDNLDEKIVEKKSMLEAAGTRGFITTADYGTTIHRSVKELGEILSSLAKDLNVGEEARASERLSVADDVVDQVDDVQESIDDLVESIEEAGEEFTFYNGKNDQLADFEGRLERIEDLIETKENIASEEWLTWFGADVNKVTIHEPVADLGGIMISLAGSLSGNVN